MSQTLGCFLFLGCSDSQPVIGDHCAAGCSLTSKVLVNYEKASPAPPCPGRFFTSTATWVTGQCYRAGRGTGASAATRPS
eukprot:scaffold76775_cov20-Prasinocladus_malaysianus.AAC.1